LDFDFGDGPLDRFIDLPPYEWDLLLLQAGLTGKQDHPAHLKPASA
jgi:hypothetical protein